MGGHEEVPQQPKLERGTMTTASLVYDASINGLSVDDVSVVQVGDRLVVMPIPRSMATTSGFTPVDVPNDALLQIGLSPSPIVGSQQVPIISAPTSPAQSGYPAASAQPNVQPTISQSQDYAPVQFGVPQPPSGGQPFGYAAAQNPGSATPQAANVRVPTPASVPVPAAPSFPQVQPTSSLEQPRGGSMARSNPARTDETPISDDVNVPVSGAVPGWRTYEEVVEAARPLDVAPPSRLDDKVLNGQEADDQKKSWPYVDRRVADSAGKPPTIEGRLPAVDTSPTGLLLRGMSVQSPDYAVIVDGIMLRYPGSNSPAINGIQLAIHAGDFVILTGPRNCGKSSLLSIIAGHRAVDSGRVLVGGKDLTKLSVEDRLTREALSVQMIGTCPNFAPDLSVLENVEIPLLWAGASADLARRAAKESLERLGVGNIGTREAATLSTSELRLAGLARTMLGVGDVIVADDPTAGLDDDTALLVLGQLMEAQTRHVAVVMATTDARIRLAGPRHITMGEGRIVADGRRVG